MPRKRPPRKELGAGTQNGGAGTQNGGEGKSLFPPPKGGFDWLTISFYGFFGASDFKATSRRLAQAKHQAGKLRETVYQDFGGGSTYFVEVDGRGLGGEYRTAFAWKRGGYTVGLHDRQESLNEQPAGYLVVPSVPLLSRSPRAIVDDCKTGLGLLGFHWERETIGRADVCVDLPNFDPSPICESLWASRFVCKGKFGQIGCYANIGNRPHGASGGSKAVYVRVYDKAYELRAKPHAEKLAAMIANRWPGEHPATAARVEFQFGRPFFKGLPLVDSFDGLLEHAGYLGQYGSTTWLRVTSSEVDRQNNHRNRAATAPEWQHVAESFNEVFGGWLRVAPQREGRKPDSPDLEHLATMLEGVASSIAARQGKTVEEVIGEMFDRGEVQGRYERKRASVVVNSPEIIQPEQPAPSLN